MKLTDIFYDSLNRQQPSSNDPTEKADEMLVLRAART